MCDGNAADDCDIMSLTEYESTLNDQLVKLDDQFIELNEDLKTKKAVFVEMYREDPRISRDEEFSNLKQLIQDFNPIKTQKIPAMETAETIKTTPITVNKEIIVCESFSKKHVNVLRCRRSVKLAHFLIAGYCFLNHPKIEKNQILKWTVRIPKLKHGNIGMVISNKLLFLNK